MALDAAIFPPEPVEDLELELEPEPAPTPPAYRTEPFAPGLGVTDYVATLTSLLANAEDSRHDWNRQVEVNWAMYFDSYNYGRLEGWQSRMAVPKVSEATDFIAGRTKAELVQSHKVFEIEDASTFLLSGEEVSRKWLTETIAQTLLDINDFPSLVFYGLQYATLSNHADYKVVPRSYGQILANSGVGLLPRNPDATLIGITNQDPRNRWHDYARQKSLEIERTWVYLHDIVRDSEGDDPIYDPEEVAKLKIAHAEKAGTSPPASDPRVQANVNRIGSPGPFKEVKLEEFWLRAYTDSAGVKILHEDVRFVLGDDHFLLAGPVKDNLGRFSPYVYSSMRPIAGTVMDGNIIEPVVGVARSITSLFNINFDAVFGESLPVRQINTAALEGAYEIYGGLYPGKIVRTTSPQAPITALALGKSSENAITMFRISNDIFDSRTGATEYSRGLPIQGRGEQTATEYKGKEQAQFVSLRIIVEWFEAKIIEPLITILLQQAAQYIDEGWMEPIFVQRLGREVCQALAGMTVEQRQEVLGIQGAVRARGLSKAVDRAAQVQRMAAISNFANLFPPEWLATNVNHRQIFQDVVEALGFNSDNWLNSPEQAAQMQAQMQAAQQAAAQQAAPDRRPQLGAAA